MKIKNTLNDFYKASAELLAAINTAMFLKRPLLLTGEPGTGKTEFADFVARRLNSAYPEKFTEKSALRFNTKSISQYSDLFYTYDAVSHFANKETEGVRSFVTFNDLGSAILASKDYDKELAGFRNYGSDKESHKPTGSVVLIDEIDKAPRDFPNDLLSELEKPPFKFRVKEAQDLEVVQNESMPIVIIISSNNEKGLPDAFLRRCIFHYIEFPDAQMLLKIVQSNLSMDDERFVTAIDLFLKLKKENLAKKPATSELIDWINCLKENDLLNGKLDELQSDKRVIDTLGVIAKSKQDFDLLKRDFES